jgi:hypothetical protein
LSSRSRSIIRCSFAVVSFSRPARPLALSANYCHSTTRSLATLQSHTTKPQQHVVKHLPLARC